MNKMYIQERVGGIIAKRVIPFRFQVLPGFLKRRFLESFDLTLCLGISMVSRLWVG